MTEFHSERIYDPQRRQYSIEVYETDTGEHLFTGPARATIKAAAKAAARQLCRMMDSLAKYTACMILLAACCAAQGSTGVPPSPVDARRDGRAPAETLGSASPPTAIWSARQAPAGALAALTVGGVPLPVIADYTHLRESTRGTDPNYDPAVPGPAGELGEYQITPIFTDEVFRLCGFRPDPHNNDQCVYGLYVWLGYHAPRVGAEGRDQLYELYRRGPSGYREWRSRQ